MRARPTLLERGVIRSRKPRPIRHRLLLAHDPRSPVCDAIANAIESAFDDVEILDAASIEGARAYLPQQPEACLVCLDLPPAPLGGVRLARELVVLRLPVVLITRSLRWLPRDAAELHEVPWIAPESEVEEVSRAIGEAIRRCGRSVRSSPGLVKAELGREPLVASSGGRLA